ncbi:MAG: hypothetical protein M3Q71_08465 [Chloroflexota bacterium]|nr:hypothetical protein [Chloroflexota bacterium]MDP9470688.1 hypothetical protein [Chloroflexota bacterium]
MTEAEFLAVVTHLAIGAVFGGITMLVIFGVMEVVEKQKRLKKEAAERQKQQDEAELNAIVGEAGLSLAAAAGQPGTAALLPLSQATTRSTDRFDQFVTRRKQLLDECDKSARNGSLDRTGHDQITEMVNVLYQSISEADRRRERVDHVASLVQTRVAQQIDLERTEQIIRQDMDRELDRRERAMQQDLEDWKARQDFEFRRQRAAWVHAINELLVKEITALRQVIVAVQEELRNNPSLKEKFQPLLDDLLTFNDLMNKTRSNFTNPKTGEVDEERFRPVDETMISLFDEHMRRNRG